MDDFCGWNHDRSFLFERWVYTYSTPPEAWERHRLCCVSLSIGTARFRPCLSGPLFHDDVIKWKHFPRYWTFVRGIHRLPVNSPHKGQWRGSLMFSLLCVWINGWVNNREAGYLRRYRAHYDVIVMSLSGRTSYRKVSWSFKAARLGVIMAVSLLWNLPGISAVLLPMWVSNFRTTGKI